MTRGLASESIFELLGMAYHCATTDEAAAWLISAALAGEKGHLCIANVHTSTLAYLDGRFRGAQQRARRIYPDGMPLVWAGRLLGSPAHRVYGPDLMWRTMDLGRAQGVRHYLLGGTQELLRRLRERIDTELPGTRIAGMRAPPMLHAGDAQWEPIFEEVGRAAPHLTWIGLGAPKQELLMDRLGSLVPGILVGAGQAFPMNAKLAARVPGPIQALGLEWCVRLAVEPRRLWKRYLLHNPLFMALATPPILAAVTKALFRRARCARREEPK